MPIRSLVVAPLPGSREQSPVPGRASRDRKFSGSVTAVGLPRKPRKGRAPQPAKLALLQRAPTARVTQHGGPGGGEGCQAGEAAPGSPHGQNNASESWPRPSCRPCGPGSRQELHWKPSAGTEVLPGTCRQNQGEGSINCHKLPSQSGQRLSAGAGRPGQANGGPSRASRPPKSCKVEASWSPASGATPLGAPPPGAMPPGGPT